MKLPLALLRGAGFFPLLLLTFVGPHRALATSVLFSNTGQTGVGTSAVTSTSYRVATDFTTNGFASTITSTVFQSFNSDDISHNVTMSIYTDNSGIPGTLLGSFSTVAVPAFQQSWAPKTATSTGISLSANTTYWEVMQIGEALGGGGIPGWEETDSQATDSGAVFTTVSSTLVKVSTNSGGSWSDDPNSHANNEFQLLGTAVPEPGCATLVLGGLAALASRRRLRT